MELLNMLSPDVHTRLVIALLDSPYEEHDDVN